MKDWYKLYATRSYPEASIIKGMLEDNSISVVVMNKQDSSYVNFGDIELYVPNHLKTKALALLHETLKN